MLNPNRSSAALLALLAGSAMSHRAAAQSTEPFPAQFNLSLLNGSNGFVLNGIDAGDLSGSSVSSAGDVNGDGVDDLIIGAWFADPKGISYAGESYVVFGGVGVGSSGVVELSKLNGLNGFTLNGIDGGDYSGRSVSSAGDVNGDGVDDLLIGAYYADPNGNSIAGESYVVFGRANADVCASPVGGVWDQGADWRWGAPPEAGIVTIDTPIGVTVTGPAGAVFLDRLTLGAGLGRTTLDLQAFSLVSVESDFTIPASAALAGSGLFVANAAFTNGGLIDMGGMGLLAPAGIENQPGSTITPTDGLIDGPVANDGEIDLSALSPSVSFVSLEVTGAVANNAAGSILLRRGAIELDAPAGITNDGSFAIAFATADVFGPVSNSLTGLVSISAHSSALFADDITNASTIVLTDDSSLVVLGSIMGNGVSGPGGAGTAGSVYVEGGIIPGILGNPFATARFDGDLDLGLASLTIIEISGANPGVDLDQIAAQHLGVGGTLQVVLANGYTPQPGDVYQVLDFVSATGSFTNVVLDPALISAGADTTDLLTNGTIFIAASCQIDLNGDGIADFGDIQTFIALFLVQDQAVDFNGDGIVDFGDIQAFIAAFLAGC